MEVSPQGLKEFASMPTSFAEKQTNDRATGLVNQDLAFEGMPFFRLCRKLFKVTDDRYQSSCLKRALQSFR